MVIALLWTVVSLVGFCVAFAVLNDTLTHYARFKRERPELVPAYRIELVSDIAITVVQGGFTTLGALSVVASGQTDPFIHNALALAGLVMLFAGPVLLMLASLNHYRSRRRL